MRTLTPLLCALLAPLLAPPAEPAPLGPMARAIETPAQAPYGLCYGQARLWVLDAQSKTITRTDPDTGCPVQTIPAPGEHPTDLAHDGRYLWVLSGNQVLVTDPDTCDVNAATTLPVQAAEGIAIDETRVWVADRATRRIVIWARDGIHIDPKIRGTLPIPGISPRGLCFQDGSLWLIDSVDRTLYRLDLATGKVTLAVFAEREFPRGVAFVRGEPVVCYQRDRVIEPLEYEVGEGYVRSCRHRVKVVYTHSVANASPKPVKDVRLTLAVPPKTLHQEIRSLELEPAPHTMSADRYGQPLAQYHYDQVAPGDHIEVRWTVEADLWAVRYDPLPAVESAADGEDNLSIYLEASKYMPLDSEVIRRHANECLGGVEDPLAKIRAARDHVLGCVDYEFAGGWDDAVTVLERGTGSCSEYSFALSAILRSNGIPTRLVGATTAPINAKTHTDKVFHRWVEAYVPGAGWLPLDANSDDRKDGPPFGSRHFLAVDWPRLIMSKGGGGDEKGTGWNYHSSQRWDWGENPESERRVRTLRTAAWEILE